MLAWIHVSVPCAGEKRGSGGRQTEGERDGEAGERVERKRKKVL